MNAKMYLQKIRKIDMLIENKLIEKEQWMTIALNITSNNEGERVKSSSSQQKMANAVCRVVEIEQEINEMIDRFADQKNEIIRTIEALSPEEYDILHKVYVQYMQLDQVADIKDKTYSWATTVHGRALKHVQDLLDERG